MSTAAMDRNPDPIPAVATLIDIKTLVGALNVVLEPTMKAFAASMIDIKADINEKHQENRESRHTLRNAVETTLAEINLAILAQRERLVNLELKVQQAVGPDGTGGAIRELKAGQVEQLQATQRVDAAVSKLDATLAEFLPAMRAMKMQQDTSDVIRHRRDSAKDWAELVLKYAALIGVGVALLKHFH